MGHTLLDWSAKVATRLRDQAFIDVDPDDVVQIGVLPAFAQYSIDQPRTVAVDLTPSGRYVALPSAGAGWVTGWSRVVRIEAPAGETPPAALDLGEWSLTLDVLDPATQVILLPFELQAGEKARVAFTSTWPTPAATSVTDLVSDIGFEAVSALAASMVCTSLAAEAGRSRQGAIPTDFVDGTDRARNLLDVAAGLRVVYNTFIGLGQLGTANTGPSRTLRSVRLG